MVQSSEQACCKMDWPLSTRERVDFRSCVVSWAGFSAVEKKDETHRKNQGGSSEVGSMSFLMWQWQWRLEKQPLLRPV